MNPLVDLTARPVIAHRGASHEAPENTMPAFELAVRQGADALEFDVRLTADGVPIVIHDPTLARTTDGRGIVGGMTAADVREFDAGARYSPDGGRSFPWRGRDVRIPTFAEVLHTFSLPLLIELKEDGMQDAVRHAIEAHNAVDRCVVAAAEASSLGRLHGTGVQVGASRRDIVRMLLRAYLAIPTGTIQYRALSVPNRHKGFPIPTRRFNAVARRLGVPVHVWTVDEPDTAHALWKSGMAGVVTNVPRVMRETRDALP